jgi:hypothetical protein
MSDTWNMAAELSVITTELEDLSALVQLYDEHSEREVAVLDRKEPWAAEVFLKRRDLALALLGAIEEKIAHITGKVAKLSERGENGEGK